jgi:hypothetical protein
MNKKMPANFIFGLKTKTLIVIITIFFSGINIATAQFCGTPNEPQILMMGGGGGGLGISDCQNYLNYKPDSYSPILYVKVNFHFMLKEDMFNPNNFAETWDGIDNDNSLNGQQWAEGVVNMMNNVQLNNNQQMNLPPNNATSVLPYNFRLDVMGVYFHEDNGLYNACNYELSSLLNTYGVNTSNEINVFFCATGAGGNGCGAGGAAGAHVIIKGAWQAYNIMLNDNSSSALADSYWSNGRLLLHEIGHCLSLGHTINSNMDNSPFCGAADDFCGDTPSYSDLVNIYNIQNPCCYYNWPTTCDPAASCTNNLMDYNCGYALTPEQLGRIFKTLLNNKINYVYEDYCTYNPNLTTTVTSGQNLLWNQVRIFKGDVIIEPQSTVRITCTVYMPEGARFIVKPGGKLILDGGTITHRCSGLWQGIEVWGNHNLNQSVESNQGVVEIINNGTIEWAKIGINTIRVLPDGTFDWSKTGGMIFCRDANFINNSKSVSFMAYHNFNSTGQIANRSSFKNTHFEITDVTRFKNQSHECFISMWDVNGVKIYGCDFKNSAPGISLTQRGNGLFTIWSTYKVGDYCNSNVPYGVDCPSNEIVRSRFENLNYAIRSAGLMKSFLLSVEHAQFFNNKGGVFLSGFGQSQIIRNDFDWNEIVELDQEQTFGVYLQECNGYEVEENFFDAHDGEETYGIAVNNSGEYATLIYRNIFHRCKAASMVYGLNRIMEGEADDHPGLEWSCNIYGEDGNASSLNYYGIGLWNNASHSSYQGTLSEEEAAGNLFYPECSPSNSNSSSERELKLMEQEFPSYYDYIHTPLAETEPLCRTFGVGLLDIQNYNWVYNAGNVCRKNISTEKSLIQHQNLISYNNEIYNQLKGTYDGYANNGSGSQLKDLINDPNKTSVEVRNALIDASPSVSDELLIAALNRTPQLDGWHMAEGLLANAPLKEAVMAELENSSYLDFYKAFVSNNQPNGFSPRTLMAMDATHYKSEQDNAKSDLIRCYSGDFEDNKPWLELIEQLNAFSYCIDPWEKAAVFLEKGDYALSNTTLSETSKDPARCELLKIALDMQQNGLVPNGLSPSQHLNLISISANSENLLSATATLMLEYWGGPIYQEFLALPEGGQTKARSINNSLNVPEVSFISVFPNPADDHIKLISSLPKGAKNIIIAIFNPEGKIIESKNLSESSNYIELNTQLWPAGIYIAELVADGIKLGTCSVSIAH